MNTTGLEIAETEVESGTGCDGETGQKGLTALTPITGVTGSTTVTTITGPMGGINKSTLSDYVDSPFTWNKDEAPGPQSEALCRRLLETGCLFHTTDGRLLRMKVGCDPKMVADSTDLEAYIREHFPVEVIKKGVMSGRTIPSGDLKILMRSPALQGALPVVDRVTAVPTYTYDWKLTEPGYNHGPEGQRIFYTGQRIVAKMTQDRINEFLGVMAWKTQGDAANALGLALTVLLRFRWPGQKPFGAITATKSHSGKDTVADFVIGTTGKAEVSWSQADWPLQNESVTALSDMNIGVLILGNIRSGSNIIESAFIERIVTSPTTLMQSSKRRDGYSRDGDFVVLATANNGRFSPDLANRSCPVHLEQLGDINNRKSPIGDPRNEFLPTYKGEILAELCGMVERWRDAGCPEDTSVKHPMKGWSRVIGGILRANGFEGFLSNWSMQRNVNDSVRDAIARIGAAARPDTWLRVDDIHKIAQTEGVIGRLMDRSHRESDRSVQQELGRTMSNHQDETLTIELEDGVKSFVLKKDRNNKTGQFATVYMFETPA